MSTASKKRSKRAVKKDSDRKQIMFWISGELEEFVDECVESGLYNNNAELIRDALRRLMNEMEWKSNGR